MAQQVLDNIRACYEQDVITWEGYIQEVERMEQYATVLPD